MAKSVTVICCAFLFLNSCSVLTTSVPAERINYFSFDPDVRVAVNAPMHPDQTKQTLLILYALPNGNTIEMTAGKRMVPDLDWHYDIQHIAAQTRFLRSLLSHINVTVAYLETKEKSWPAWRQKRPSDASDIARIVEFIRFETGNPNSLILSGHSGGGSFITGFINAFDSIPSFVSRICYLDANYSYTDSLDHGKKLYHWLKSDRSRVLTVLAYDDREITINGKKIIGPTGGTYRATQRMLHSFTLYDSVVTRQDSAMIRSSAMQNQVRMFVHMNPDTAILHTVLVERNGFIHSILTSTAHEEVRYRFFGDRAYHQYISEE
jgi:hypothetical protein